MSAARTSAGSLASDSLNACAVPAKSAWTLGGMPMRACAASMALTASPSDSPAARLNEIVTAGNWPWWLIASGAVVVVSCTIALSGTGAPVGVRTKRLSSAGGRPRLLRLHLEDDAVEVQLREDDRHLPLAEGVVERVVDGLRRDAQARGRVAVDRERHLETGGLLVARDVLSIGRSPCGAPSTSRGAQIASSFGSGVLERVLVLRPADAAVDLQVLHRLQVELDAVHLRELRLEARDDLVRARRALRSRGLSVIERRPLLVVGFVPSEPMNEATFSTSGIGEDHVGERRAGAPSSWGTRRRARPPRRRGGRPCPAAERTPSARGPRGRP